MSRTTRDYLADIATNADLALDAMKGRRLKHFSHDWAFRAALQFVLVIMDTAIAHIPAALKSQHPEAPWEAVREMGARMHYDRRHEVDDAAVWHVLSTQFAPLRDAARRILADLQKLGGSHDTPLQPTRTPQVRGR